MKPKYLAVLAALAVAALVFAATALSRSSMSVPTLKGVVGPGFTISLKKAGKTVKTLKAGKYRIVVSDKSAIHNFTLERERPRSPHIEKHISSTAFTGSKSITMTLKKGSWRAYCSIHESQMHHDFRVK